jgi:phosphohistidine swiveling domain-containing protein
MKKKNKINWVWSHRRKMSLHHLDIFCSGLINDGFSPALNYVQNNQLAVVLPGNDTYLFDDADELAALEDVIILQTQGKDFAKNLLLKNSELFGSLLLMSGDMRRSNLALYSREKILSLYDDFIRLITRAPLIRIQLTGIDACWSKNSPLRQELWRKAGSEERYREWVRIVSCFSGESVAKSEQSDFLLLAKEFYRTAAVRNLLLAQKTESAQVLLEKKYLPLNTALVNHICKYEWISSEYTGEGWDAKRWLEEIAKFLKVDPLIKIKEILADEKAKSKAKRELLRQLGLGQKSLRIVEALDCFSVIRDWSKGYFVRALLNYRFLLAEIAGRAKIDFESLLNFNIIEVREILVKGRCDVRELKKRQANGAIMIMLGSNKKFYTDSAAIKRIKNMPVVREVFAAQNNVKEFRGKTGYPGKIKGRVKVILQSQNIKKVDKGDILVTYMTTMEFTPVFKKIAALITDEGGISSHAAIISREFKIPCIVGSKVATRVLKDGDLVEVDADKGVIKILK